MQLEGLVIPISFDTGVLLKGVGMITDLIEGAVAQTFKWADGMDHLGDVTGMTNEQTAAWAFTVRKAGGDVDAFANSTVILTKGLFDSEGKLSTTGKALEDFGVSITDANGNVKDQATLMSDIAGKYATFGTATERVDFLTNIFGRSGANLVDVFDTLAQEGGIDAVSQKVKDLGLAIDPDRYEQFTRNLEELKLAGTGIAIEFTEMLMPALESMLSWGTRFAGQDWAGKMQMVQDELAKFSLPDITQKFEDWVASVDWDAVSTDFAKWITTVDWAGGVTDAINSAVNLETAFIDLIQRTNWGAVGSALKGALVGIMRDAIGRALGEAWEGAAVEFWKMVDNAFNSNFGAIAQESANRAALAAETGGAPLDLAGAPRNAAGGPAGGMTWVGENGPELVNLPRGSYVNNNQTSNRIAQGSGQVFISSDQLDEMARTLARVLGQQMQRA